MLSKITSKIVSNIVGGVQQRPISCVGKCVPNRSADVFERTIKNSPIKEIKGIPVEIVGDVSQDFIKKISKQIDNFPQRWLDLFKENDYKIVLSKNITDAYKAKGVRSSLVKQSEKINPNGLLGVTHHNEQSRLFNFFCFCDKPPLSDIYMQNIVNHEFGHGLCNIKKLDSDLNFRQALIDDLGEIQTQKKLDSLSESERKLVSHYFFNKKAYLSVDEIIADLFAWQQKGGGCYGTTLILDKENKNLMPYLFPNLNEAISNL